MASFTARFYGVTHCGYYAYGASDPTLAGLEETLQELEAWSLGKSLLATKVEGIGEKLPTYLLDIKSYGGCWVLTLWNEVPSEDGAIASVMGTDPVGAVDIQSTTLQAGAIPGFPTYAVFLPADDLYVALKHSDVILGTEQLKGYMETFLSRSARWVDVDDADPEDVIVLGYVDDDGESHESLYPRFVIQVRKTGDLRAKIIENHEHIRTVIRVTQVNPLRAPDRALFQRALQVAGIEAEPRGKSVRIRQEFPVQMSRVQVVSLLNSVGDDLVPKRNDVAVRFARDPKEYWLSGTIPHLDLDIQIDREQGVFKADALARKLWARRAALLEAAEQ